MTRKPFDWKTLRFHPNDPDPTIADLIAAGEALRAIARECEVEFYKDSNLTRRIRRAIAAWAKAANAARKGNSRQITLLSRTKQKKS